MATEPGNTISLSAAFVAMSTIVMLSGSALPSRKPGISSNCRLISSMIAWAALPTAIIVLAPTAYGRHAPIKRPTRMGASSSLKTKLDIPAASRTWLISRMNAENKLNTVSVAEPIAKPLPMAAVVLPTESSSSVMARTSGPSLLISLMPPALSEIGPYASTVITIAVPASMPTAPIAMP